MNKIVIATRESQLALWQANFVKAQLEASYPELEVELLGITTKGDRWLNQPLREIGGKGLFINELEDALLAGKADLAVHSMKDVPAKLTQGFTLGAIGFRDDVRDCFVSRGDTNFKNLAIGAKIGSSSLRRVTQILADRPDLEVLPIRGNVNTRLAKLDSGEFDAIILAAAGLNRLGFENRITSFFDPEQMLPAAGQGALGIECCTHRTDLISLLGQLNDSLVSACVIAERKVSEVLGADCSSPVAAYAVSADGQIRLRGLVASLDGQEIVRAEFCGVEPQEVGTVVANSLLDLGAERILAV